LGNKYKVPDFQQVTAKNTKISSISRHKNEKNTILVGSGQWAVDGRQLSVVSGQSSVVSGKWAVASHQSLVISPNTSSQSRINVSSLHNFK
jgi:hypothetical protein